MKKLYLAMLVLSIIAASSQSLAGYQSGQVTQLVVRASDNLHYFYLSGSAEGRPDCAVGHTYGMIKDETSDVGRTQWSMLLAAYMSGKPVRVTGFGTCDRWRDGEDVNYIQMQ